MDKSLFKDLLKSLKEANSIKSKKIEFEKKLKLTQTKQQGYKK
ncbi:hypothetical protein FNL37_0739 [Methylovorus glucosotrophus]|nr:hypothetical protein FNL37_0739 [Methylovorus glucosotrophus]